VVPPGVFIDVHEKLAADFLASRIGYDVTFLVPSRRKGAKTPDIEMLNKQFQLTISIILGGSSSSLPPRGHCLL